jgi:hypothetical protein
MIDDLRKRYPKDRYPACARAIELGIDVSLLEANLRLSVVERLERAARHQQAIDELQARTLTEAQRQALELRRIREKYGITDESYYGQPLDEE